MGRSRLESSQRAFSGRISTQRPHAAALSIKMPRLTRSPPRLITLTLLTALSALTLNMVLPSLPSMARDLAARESVTALVVSGYMVASALFKLGLGPISDHFGRRPVMLGALLLFMESRMVEKFVSFRFCMCVCFFAFRPRVAFPGVTH